MNKFSFGDIVLLKFPFTDNQTFMVEVTMGQIDDSVKKRIREKFKELIG